VKDDLKKLEDEGKAPPLLFCALAPGVHAVSDISSVRTAPLVCT